MTAPRIAPPVPVLREDSHLLAVFKPPGWIVQGAGPDQDSLLDALRAWIRQRDEKPGEAFLSVVHRLDGPVSGVVVFAKRTKAASRLSREIREGRFEKDYRAVVEGTPSPMSAALVDRLIWDDDARRARVVEGAPEGSAAAELSYAVLDRRGGRSLLGIRLVTGRKHQIRAQLAHRDCPILGDTRYGSRERLDAGIALCSFRVAFRHPVRDEDVEVAIPAELDPTGAWLGASAGRR
ncbi:MAG: RluA family pseudouridine synthase [Candidatus Eiseniibacteriota bacterium]